MRRNSTRLAAVACACLFAAPEAHAHLTSSGLGPFYDGMMHLVMSPADLLPLVALALLAGLRGAAAGRAVLFALPLAWLAGGIAGLQLPAELSMPAIATLLVVLYGACVAADLALSRAVVVLLAALAGLLLGVANGSSIAAAGGGASSIAGIASVAFVAVALLASVTVSLRDGWQRIVVRVAGSWIAAIGMLMFGWAARG